MNESEPEKEKDPRFELVAAEIEKIISKSSLEEDSIHSKLVRENVLKLIPEADDALQIAALAHDIDRGIEEEKIRKENFESYDDYKKAHALKSAEIAGRILADKGYDQEFIERVKILIEQHETGGKEGAAILRDADGMAFFQYNLPFHLKTHRPEETKEKIKFMYITLSDQAKEEVRKIEFPEEVRGLFFEAIGE